MKELEKKSNSWSGPVIGLLHDQIHHYKSNLIVQYIADRLETEEARLSIVSVFKFRIYSMCIHIPFVICIHRKILL